MPWGFLIVFQKLNFFGPKKNPFLLFTFAIVGRTAGPNWLTFVEGTHGYPGGNIGKKKIFLRSIFFFKNPFFFIPRATTGTLSS